MLRLVYNEVFKIFARKKIFYFALIILCVNLLPWFESVMGTIDIPINGWNIALYMLGTYAVLLLPIFIIILVGDMITEEYAGGTLKLTLIHPVSRTRFLVAKFLALGTPIAALTILSLAASYIMGGIFFGWGGHFTYENLEYTTVGGTLLTLKSYLVSILPLWVFGLVLILVALQFTSSGAYVGVSMGIMILLGFVGQVAPAFRPFLISEHFRLYKTLMDGDVIRVVLVLLVMTVYGIGAALTSARILQKKDLVY